MKYNSKNSLREQRSEQRQLIDDLERTNERITIEASKDIMDQDHAQLTWLLNHREILEHRLNGTYKPSCDTYTILN